MRKVLIPTDFSENAFNALKYACQVFKYEKSEFYIIHAYADEVYREDIAKERSTLETLKASALERSDGKLKQTEDQLKEYSANPKHTYTFVSVFANLIDAANDWVEHEDMDIVVMGTRGATSDGKIVFGSNTLQVMRYVNCPVLAIPEDYEYQPPKQVLFATNYMVPYKNRELKLLGEMTGSFCSTVHMLYIDPINTLSLRQEDNREFLKNCLSKPKLRFETTPEKEKTFAITKYILHNDIDMLVIVNSRHSYLEDMLYQSSMDKLGLHLKIPFMVLQNIAR
ncbi:Nucleotide-binding universal stress protein, UspA family [Pricia antarctica]|uniref:Nucleotide-binding universal stress protein, UspA family n=1 Tax=Pricia antarctica TaxID=641691 RepID=A0A1G7D9W9_9FLAO|nr:universal stress protein [Pricia antarctica]SDE48351.1 Nucleotide-binding universal stress protein, UspA family [Pricia antarctica]